jgi:hypothetical protein
MKNYDLKYFIIRTNILLLYREAFKFTYQVKDLTVREDLQNYLRNEFEVNRNLTDRKKIEYLIGHTRKKLNSFKETYYMSN